MLELYVYVHEGVFCLWCLPALTCFPNLYKNGEKCDSTLPLVQVLNMYETAQYFICYRSNILYTNSHTEVGATNGRKYEMIYVPYKILIYWDAAGVTFLFLFEDSVLMGGHFPPYLGFGKC